MKDQCTGEPAHKPHESLKEGDHRIDYPDTPAVIEGEYADALAPDDGEFNKSVVELGVPGKPVGHLAVKWLDGEDLDSELYWDNL